MSSGDEFVISRDFDAPRELVFKAWTEPAHLARWWGPKEFSNSCCVLDVRPGGAYRIVMRSPEGVEYPLTGVYREVVENRKLVYTMDISEHPPEWHAMLHKILGETRPVGMLLNIVTFEEHDGRTKLTVQIRFDSAAIRDAMLKMGMTEGWSQSLERLKDLLTKD